ncbi:MAG: zinc ribbon domain-containing protein [Bacteroidaceae bacterium]|nr:zinc ribbon domain-containing protein [Bacteroidaceae bacterium]
MALVKCENCGAPVSNLGTKCPKCGTPIRKGNDGSANEVTPAKPKRQHCGMVGLVVAVIVVAVGAAAFLLLGGKSQAVEVSDPDNYQEEYSDDAEDYLDSSANWDDNYQEEYSDDAEDYLDPSANWDNNFPTPEYIYTGLLNPQTSDEEEFFADLREHDFYDVENGYGNVTEYRNVVGSLSLLYPYNAALLLSITITIYEDAERQRFEEKLNTFFSDKVDCTIDYRDDGSIIIAYDY